MVHPGEAGVERLFDLLFPTSFLWNWELAVALTLLINTHPGMSPVFARPARRGKKVRKGLDPDY